MIKMKNRMILLTGIFLIMSLLASCAGLQNTQGKSAVNDAFAPFIQKTKDGKNEVEMPGGRKEYKYQDAARTITSKEITSFKCEFERPYLWQAPYSYCIFDLERKDDDALCKIQTIRRPQIIADLEFETPLSALDSLQTMIDEHDLAKQNGISNHTNGLPERFGVSLRVEYVSGEWLSFQDNQDVIISEKATVDLHDFFRDLAQEAGYHFVADGEKDMEVTAFKRRAMQS